MSDRDFGIDFGTSRVVIYATGSGVILDEPAMIAIEKSSGRMFACGKEAYEMQGRAPASIEVVRPLEKGVIAHFDYACMMLKYFMQKVCARKIVKPRTAVTIPASVTAVEQCAFQDVLYAAGARQVLLIEKTMAAAVGAGVDVEMPQGSMVVEIGAGTTDVAVTSLGGLASSCSNRIGGDALDEAIMRYMRQKYQLVIGKLMAEKLKIEIGKVANYGSELTMQAKGRHAVSGLPCIVEVTSSDIVEAVKESIAEMMKTIKTALENTPPELSADIYDNGIILTGGTVLMRGMERLVTEVTGIHCRIAHEPMYCVAKGAAATLLQPNAPHTGIYDVEQFLQHGSETMP